MVLTVQSYHFNRTDPFSIQCASYTYYVHVGRTVQHVSTSTVSTLKKYSTDVSLVSSAQPTAGEYCVGIAGQALAAATPLAQWAREPVACSRTGSSRPEGWPDDRSTAATAAPRWCCHCTAEPPQRDFLRVGALESGRHKQRVGDVDGGSSCHCRDEQPQRYEQRVRALKSGCHKQRVGALAAGASRR